MNEHAVGSVWREQKFRIQTAAVWAVAAIAQTSKFQKVAPKFFKLIKLFNCNICNSNKYFNVSQQNCFKVPFLRQNSVEP